MRFNRLDSGIALILAAGTVAVFAPAFRADFIGMDDQVYVVFNRHVLGGWNSENFVWAWRFQASNWHPLTWLSLQLDAMLFGKSPTGYHVENIVLHALNAVVLFLALRSLTGASLRSGIVAALFAWHPLRAESVAWISERKDVLSMFFGLLSLWAYAAYVRRRSRTLYLAAGASLALSLLAKPTLVTLPCLMLVLDAWPLRRTGTRSEKPVTATGVATERGTAKTTKSASGKGASPSLASVRLWLVVEKLPFFVLTVATSILAYLAQKSGGSIRTIDTLSIDTRIANALVAYATYPGMMLWPVGLAPMYPIQQLGWSVDRVTVSVVVVIVLSIVAVWQWRQRPYLLTGWLWYLGTLVPVIGLVQVGNQAYADRYTYFPSIGLCLAVVWMVADAVPAAQARLAVALAGATALVLAVLTWYQVGYWQDDLKLWPHTLAATGPNAHAYNSLGVTMELRKRFDEALQYYQKAVATNAGYSPSLYNLGRLLQRRGDDPAATVYFLKAMRTDPYAADPHADLAAILCQYAVSTSSERQYRDALRRYLKTIPASDPFVSDKGNGLASILGKTPLSTVAEDQLQVALRLNPEHIFAKDNLGWLYEQQGRYEQAIELFRQVLRIDPASARTHHLLGICFSKRGDFAPCVEHLRRAAELQPNSAGAMRDVGVALEKFNKTAEAIECFQRAINIDPRDLPSRLRLAGALSSIGDRAGAEAVYRKVSAMDPSWPDVVMEQAWSRATSPNARERDAEVAVWAAETGCRAVQPVPVNYLDALAAAYAEAGRFSEAIAQAEKALAAATAAGNSDQSKAIAHRLALYRAGEPYRDVAALAAR